MYDVRLYIRKTGDMKYVSHLDMFRLMQRAVRRAGIPLWYTEGFNPHPYISFLQALPLGVESEREPCDIKIVDDMSTDEIMNRLNATMPGEFRIVAAVKPRNKPSQIEACEYELTFSPDVITAQKLGQALASGTLSCEKSGKAGKKKEKRTVSVSDSIFSYSVSENGGTVTLKVTVAAGTSFNLSPSNLLEGISGFSGSQITPLNVKRISFLCADGSYFE